MKDDIQFPKLETSVQRTFKISFSASSDELLQAIESKKKYEIKISYSPSYFNEKIVIHLNIWINIDNKLPGYCIFAESFNYFNLENQSTNNLTHSLQLIELACVEASINAMREFVEKTTKQFLLGSYIIPKFSLMEDHENPYSLTKKDHIRWN